VSDPTSPLNPWNLLHVATGAVFALGAWIAKDHFKRDDKRFDYLGAEIRKVDAKLDAQNKTIADNHAEILRILIDKRV
jgi:hypothetical protein